AVVDAGRRAAVDQRDQLSGQVAGPSGLPDLGGDDVDAGVPSRQLDHGANEVWTVLAVEPGRSHYVTAVRQQLPNGPLAGQLGAPVRGARMRRGLLRIRLRGPAPQTVG